MEMTKKTISILIGIGCCVLAIILSSILGGDFGTVHTIFGFLAICVVVKFPSWGGFVQFVLAIHVILLGLYGIAMYFSIWFSLAFIVIGCSWIVAAIFAWLYKPQTAA